MKMRDLGFKAVINEHATKHFIISSTYDLNSALHAFRRIGHLVAADPAFLQRLDSVAYQLVGPVLESSTNVEMTIIECNSLVQLLVTHQGVVPFETLSNVRGQVDEFDYYAHSGHVTFLYAGLFMEKDTAPPYAFGAICVPIKGETVCGDAWAIKSNRALVCDGLGHGIEAAEASHKAVQIFLDHDLSTPMPILVERIHAALTGTRGCALAIVEIQPETCRVKFCGVGNIAGLIFSNTLRYMASKNGTAGYCIGRVQTYDYSWDPHALVVMTSDGISTRLDLTRYAGLQSRHPAIVAAVVYQDFKRLNDDVTVLVMGAHVSKHDSLPQSPP